MLGPKAVTLASVWFSIHVLSVAVLISECSGTGAQFCFFYILIRPIRHVSSSSFDDLTIALITNLPTRSKHFSNDYDIV